MAHGVNITEQPTGVKPAVRISAGIPVYFGTAPINSVDLTNVNKPKVCYSLAEAVAAFGAQTDDFANWTLHEAIKAHFSVYSVAPVVLVNVIDPDNAAHVASTTGQSHQLVDGEVQLQVYGGPDEPQLGVIESTVVVTGKTLGTDYTLSFDDDGFMVVTVVEGGSLSDDDVILVDFDYLDPTGVTTDDIIGGYSAGSYTGIEVVEQVYPALRLVPGFLLAPGYSHIPEVGARLATKANSINGSFRAVALCDLSTDTGDIPSYAEAPAWKSDNGYDAIDQIACWPKFKNGDDAYHMSTVVACVANVTDSTNNGIPFESPSNKKATGTAAVNDDGDEILLTKPQANALNAQGIVTMLNGLNGWRVWGNRTAVYPGNTDPKDAFFPIRRMFSWIANTITLTTDANVDDPISRRLIDLVMSTIQSYLNGLIASQALVAGVIEFRTDENSTVDLSDGKITWHVTLTPPSPGEQLDFTLEYDPTALAELFPS